MEDLINHLITVASGLGILGAGYLVWLLSGVANVVFTSGKKWSWRKMLQDLTKALLMAVAILSWVAVFDALDWFTAKMGADITAVLDGASLSGLVGGIIGGTAYFLLKGYKNFYEFINSNHVEVPIENPDYEGVAEGVKDTITKLTVKEQFKKDGVEETESEEISEKEAGQGGLTNTYPEPYRSAPKDSLIDPSTCYSRECVSYCAWKIAELKGTWPRRTGSMNAREWINRLPEWGYKEVSRPQNGGKYIGVLTGGTYGHVYWFEFDTTISEYNYASLGNYGVRSVNLAEARWFEIQAPTTPTPTPTPSKKEVKYTYKAGDTFGQVILDLGLNTDHGLWGEDGDVAYYTAQLHNQGIYGNIPIGTTITLKPRK